MTSSRTTAVTLATLALITACDRAERGYHECVKLEAQGMLVAAFDACEKAHETDSTSKSGELAASKAGDIRTARENELPPTVTREWCARLRSFDRPTTHYGCILS
jgi:hypothetical protein